MNNINAKEIKGTRNKKSDFWSRRSLCWEFPMGVGAHVMSPRHVTSVNTIGSRPTPWSLNRKNDRYEIFIASSQTRATICKVTGFPKLLALRKQGTDEPKPGNRSSGKHATFFSISGTIDTWKRSRVDEIFTRHSVQRYLTVSLVFDDLLLQISRTCI